MKCLKLLPLVLFLPQLACGQGASGTTTISSVIVDPTNNVVMVFGASVWSNPDGCPLSNIVLLPTSNLLYKDILAATLTALTAGKTVSFWLSGCTNSSWGSAPAVVQIQVNA